MEGTNYRIGYSDCGGVYIGKNIQSDFHEHHLLAIVLSFSETFEITTKTDKPIKYEVAIIPKDTEYKLTTSLKDWTVFIHLDPYSEIGLKLNIGEIKIHSLKRSRCIKLLNISKSWLDEPTISKQDIDNFLQEVVTTLTIDLTPRTIDERIHKCIKIIRQSDFESFKLKDIADQVFLSPSRLSHLFKQETGLTFKKYILHHKLVKSLKAMHNQQNLTNASNMGGFSDQPHFTKTFKKSFGIKPSSSKH